VYIQNYSEQNSNCHQNESTHPTCTEVKAKMEVRGTIASEFCQAAFYIC